MTEGKIYRPQKSPKKVLYEEKKMLGVVTYAYNSSLSGGRDWSR
jgi:hypothetical protein